MHRPNLPSAAPNLPRGVRVGARGCICAQGDFGIRAVPACRGVLQRPVRAVCCTLLLRPNDARNVRARCNSADCDAKIHRVMGDRKPEPLFCCGQYRYVYLRYAPLGHRANTLPTFLSRMSSGGAIHVRKKSQLQLEATTAAVGQLQEEAV